MSLEAPQIELIPEVGDGWCVFKWQPPQNTMVPIKNYKLVITTLNNEILLDGTNTLVRQTSLENGKTYHAFIQASLDGITWGKEAHFSEFETGRPCSVGPMSAQVVPLTPDSVCISLTPPSIAPDTPIRWYVLESHSTCPSDKVESHTILANANANTTTETFYTLENCSFQGRYRFYVYAVNCAGYSPATPTNWIFNEPVPDFVLCAEFTKENTLSFVNFNKDRLSTNTWTQSGYSYNTTSPNSIFLSVGRLFTNSVTYCISVYKSGNPVGYAGIMMSRYPEKGSGLCLAGNGKTLGYYWNDSSTSLPVDTGVSLEDNQWTHLVLTISPEKIKLYKNAIQVYEHTRVNDEAQITRLFFGRNPVTDTLCFPGLLSNIRFYKYVLSDTDITNIFYTLKN